MSTTETWKVISGYPNYEISDEGRVRSTRFNKILKGCASDSGYLYVNLVHEKRVKTTAIHKLVITHFGEQSTEEFNVVDHLDKDKTNNRIDNLQWVSMAENTLRYYANHDKKEKILELRKRGLTLKEIAKMVELSPCTVQQHIIRNNS